MADNYLPKEILTEKKEPYLPPEAEPVVKIISAAPDQKIENRRLALEMSVKSVQYEKATSFFTDRAKEFEKFLNGE